MNTIKFEEYWVKCNVKHDFNIERTLPDEEYIDYHIWEDIHWQRMYEKYLPDTLVIRGDNPNIIFHGGCLGCISQQKHGIDRCKGCLFFKSDRSKPNLEINLKYK